jgi:hypothetical protein
MEAVCALIEIPMHVHLLTATRMGEPIRLNSSDLAATGSPGEIVTSRRGASYRLAHFRIRKAALAGRPGGPTLQQAQVDPDEVSRPAFGPIIELRPDDQGSGGAGRPPKPEVEK